MPQLAKQTTVHNISDNSYQSCAQAAHSRISATTPTNRRGLVIIDPSISNIPLLLNGLQPSVEAVVLDAQADAIAHITDLLQQRPHVTELHLVAHGSPGELHLGHAGFSWATIRDYRAYLQQWNLQTLYIYGCNVAVGDAGSDFLDTLHSLTNATVYASSSPIGHSTMGGNWILDTTFGHPSLAKFAPTLAFSTDTQATYPGTFETYKVTTLVDENDGGSGGSSLSLREAVEKANANPGTDKIIFKASLKNGTIVLENGKIDITDGLNIEGLGADKLTVSGNNQSQIFSISDSSDTNILDVSIDDLSITGGPISNSPFNKSNEESAILNEEKLILKRINLIENNGLGVKSFGNDETSLKIINSKISGNKAGIYTDNSNLDIQGSTISKNQWGMVSTESNRNTTNTIRISGSTISNNERGLSTREGDVEISSSTISGNTTGVFTSYDDLTIQNSIISGNEKGIDAEGAFVSLANTEVLNNNQSITGIYHYVNIANSIVSGNLSSVSAYYDLTVSDSVVTDNAGGLVAGSFISVSTSTISGNDFGVDGSYVSIYSSSISNNRGTGVEGNDITIENSTISDNDSDGVFMDEFFYNQNQSLKLINSTISNNSGHGLVIGPRRYAEGSALEPISISNSTITGNGAGNRERFGGGIFDARRFPEDSEYFNPIRISNSIVAKNRRQSDIFADFISEGNNFIGNGDGSTGLIDGANGDFVGTSSNVLDPRLGPLQDNGGFTKTHALLSDSLAIDAGNNALIPGGTINDQRGSGFNRIVNGTVDIGAFEVQVGPIPSPSGEDIIGTIGKDNLQGTAAGERIEGLDGNDVMDGKAGNDSLIGGLGKDNLTGGIGADAFIFESLADRGDTIRDWEIGIDTIDLSQVFSAPQFAGFSDSIGRFDNYVRFRSRSNGVSVEVDQLGDNGTQFVRMAFVRAVDVADLSIGDLRLT